MTLSISNTDFMSVSPFCPRGAVLCPVPLRSALLSVVSEACTASVFTFSLLCRGFRQLVGQASVRSFIKGALARRERPALSRLPWWRHLARGQPCHLGEQSVEF